MMRLIILLSFIFTGCSFQTPILDSEHERSGFVITKPPMQVSFRGDVTEETKKFALEAIDMMKTIPHTDYRFNENHNVRLNSIDGKVDKIDVNLHESTTTGVPPPQNEVMP